MQPLSGGPSSLPLTSKSFRNGAVTSFSFKESIFFFLHCKEKIKEISITSKNPLQNHCARKVYNRNEDVPLD